MGGQYHHELIKYCPPTYVLCVSSHFWPFTIVKFVLEKIDKNLRLGQTPAPLVGTKSQVFPKVWFEGSPKFTKRDLFSRVVPLVAPRRRKSSVNTY